MNKKEKKLSRLSKIGDRELDIVEGESAYGGIRPPFTKRGRIRNQVLQNKQDTNTRRILGLPIRDTLYSKRKPGEGQLAKGLTTIEKVREEYKELWEVYEHIYYRVALKAWLYHSESRNRNNNPPFTFSNYENHMEAWLFIEQIELGMINCEGIGTKEEVIEFLRNWR